MRTSTLLGLAVALGIVILALKLVAYLLTGSVALLSDALESLVNVVAAGLALVAARAASRPADLDHPFGHGKFEYLSAVIEAVLIIVAAALIAWQAVGRLVDPQPIADFGIAALLALAASGLNGGLAALLVREGGRKRSPALIAEGAHLWTDVATTVGVLAGLLLAWLTGWSLLDPLVALLVAANIVRVGWRLLRDSVGGLVDESLPEAELAAVEAAIRNAMAGSLEVHDLRTRRAGRGTFVTLHLIVPAAMTVAEAHAICDRIESAVAEALPGARVTTHVEPEGKAKRLGSVVRMGESDPLRR